MKNRISEFLSSNLFIFCVAVFVAILCYRVATAEYAAIDRPITSSAKVKRI